MVLAGVRSADVSSESTYEKRGDNGLTDLEVLRFADLSVALVGDGDLNVEISYITARQLRSHTPVYQSRRCSRARCGERGGMRSM